MITLGILVFWQFYGDVFVLSYIIILSSCKAFSLTRIVKMHIYWYIHAFTYTHIYFLHAWIHLRVSYMVWTQAGHGWDVKSVDWHPTKSLLVSGMCQVDFPSFLHDHFASCHCNAMLGFSLGGKDNVVKLWDAKTGRELCSLWVNISVKFIEMLTILIILRSNASLLQSWP